MSNLVYLAPRNYNHSSRYRIYKQIADTQNNTVYLESINPVELSSSGEIFHSVEDSEENRLDIIAKKYYGSASMYWVIAMANNIIDPMSVFKGTILKIPRYEALFENGGPLIGRYY
jgi:hypothetical protein